MAAFARRILVVVAAGFGLFLVVQGLLSRDELPGVRLAVEIVRTSRDGAAENWAYRVYETGRGELDGRPCATDVLAAKLTGSARWTATARDGDGRRLWTFETTADGRRLFNGAPATAAQFVSAIGGAVQPTRPVSVADVLAAKIPSPMVENVSFPTFSYRDAFPDGKADKLIEIKHFQQAPMLDDLSSMPARWRRHYPASLPPVAERLPRNPGVVRGCDGIGRYGGVWRRCTSERVARGRRIRPESFTRFDPSGRLMPALAYKWEVGPGNRVFTFYLRKGHKWSDGHPFTSGDILWVCNTLIGSPYWSSPPNWMQATDGTAMLYVEDILDWGGLIAALRRQIAAGRPSPGMQLANLGGAAFLRRLAAMSDEGEPSAMDGLKFVETLNALIRRPEFLSVEAWAGVDTVSDLAALEARGASRLSKEELERVTLLYERRDLFEQFQRDRDSLADIERAKLNLLMFRAAYRPMVDIARKKRVKVEAVPDEDGDDSHIVRFTFPKPNAIFLEKTATFMFYRGIFILSRHFTSKYHPEGSKVLNRIDVLDWDELLARIRRQNRSDGPTPGGRLWSLLDEAVRADPPSADSSEAAKQAFVDAVNSVLERSDFYAPRAWAGVDFDAEYDRLTAEGFVALRRDPAAVRRVRELLIRRDLLKRVGEAGVESLTRADRFRFNLMMLRAAFDDGGEADGPLASNREHALNRLAQRHPRKYSSWVKLMLGLRNYHPTENPHFPTLRAWRDISEKADAVFTTVRNPYYYKVDEQGNQLPYIDAVETRHETQTSNILMTLASGNVDCQMQQLGFENFTYLKEHESTGGYRIRLWASDCSGEIVFYPLQCHKDEAFRALQDDPRFRHALSLALDRREIIDVCYSGLATPAQAAVPAGSPYYCEDHARRSIDYDPAEADRLLDAMGLDRRNREGVRLLSDGRPLIMNVDTPDSLNPAPVIMACEYWRRIGISAQMKIRGGPLLGRMIDLGILDIGVYKGGASYFGPLLAGGFAPTHPAECGQWKHWVSYLRYGGRQGWEPPERMREVELLWEKVLTSGDETAKRRAWDALSRRTADDLPQIGLLTPPGVMVYVRDDFKNVPDLALAGWIAHSPGNCCPEVFFFDR